MAVPFFFLSCETLRLNLPLNGTLLKIRIGCLWANSVIFFLGGSFFFSGGFTLKPGMAIPWSGRKASSTFLEESKLLRGGCACIRQQPLLLVSWWILNDA